MPYVRVISMSQHVQQSWKHIVLYEHACQSQQSYKQPTKNLRKNTTKLDILKSSMFLQISHEPTLEYTVAKFTIQ